MHDAFLMFNIHCKNSSPHHHKHLATYLYEKQIILIMQTKLVLSVIMQHREKFSGTGFLMSALKFTPNTFISEKSKFGILSLFSINALLLSKFNNLLHEK